MPLGIAIRSRMFQYLLLQRSHLFHQLVLGKSFLKKISVEKLLMPRPQMCFEYMLCKPKLSKVVMHTDKTCHVFSQHKLLKVNFFGMIKLTKGDTIYSGMGE